MTTLREQRKHCAPNPKTNSISMGQQTNKIQKRRRRANYLERSKAKAQAAPAKPKAVKKKAAPKKEKPAPAAAE